jgi:hypothetical protein
MKRREFLHGLPLATVGAAAFPVAIPLIFPSKARAQAEVLTSAEVTTFQNNLMPLLQSAITSGGSLPAITNVARGLQTQVSSLSSKLSANGFDAAYKAALATVNTSSFTTATVTSSQAAVVADLFPALQAAGFKGTKADFASMVQYTMSPVTTIVNGQPVTNWEPGSSASQLGFLKSWIDHYASDGFIDTLDSISDNIGEIADDTATGTSSQGCAAFNLIIGLLTAAFWTLLAGCAPVDPIFVIICPVVVIIGTILTILSILSLILC